MDKETAKEKLKRQIDQTSTLQRNSPEFKKWRRDTELVIEHVFGLNTRHIQDFRAIRFTPTSYSMIDPDPAFESAFRAGIGSSRAILESMVGELDEYWPNETVADTAPPGALSRLERICNRFHLVVRQLRSRHDQRQTLDVNDEYDVQDLLHALLRIDFDDIRPEEWTPSYAGKSSRIDFLLKEHQIVVEVKKTRRGLGVKELGDQLIIDIARYKQHPDCNRLICFIYDAEGLIGNPSSLERDISSKSDEFEVQVIVAPKGV